MRQAFEPKTPIIIHQMGKVASMTVEQTLRNTLPQTQIFRSHMLAESRWNLLTQLLAAFPESEYPPEHRKSWANQLEQGKRLRGQIEEFKKLIDAGSTRPKLNVITLVRDPVAITVSSFFQNLTIFFPNAESRCKTESADQIIAGIQSYYLNCVKSFLGQQPTPETLQYHMFGFILSLIPAFFDAQLKPVFDIDVYSSPFSPAKGYDIYEGKYARVLLVRVENLDQVIHAAFRDFLGIEQFEVSNKNVSSEKFYKDIYARFKDTISLPQAFVDYHYSCKFARHFYTPKELSCFKHTWTKSVPGISAKLVNEPMLSEAMLPNTTCWPTAYTEVPGRAPIELVAYYTDFLDYYPRCEMPTKRWFVENVQPDWVILDGGANIGYYSIMFARLAPNGHVYAFEPTSTIEKLRQNIEHNGVRNVTCIQAALGNKTGQHVDKIYRIWGQEPEQQKYQFITIDEFVRANELRRVDCIKIDVDSFDFEVLQGAAKTMARFNPFVMVELNHALNKRGQSAAEALEWLTSQGYEECVVFEYENYLFKKGYRYSGHEGRLSGLRLLFAGDQSVLAERLTNYLSGLQHQASKDTGVGKYAEKSNIGFGKAAETNSQPIFERSTSVGAVCTAEKVFSAPQPQTTITIPSVPIQQLHKELGFATPIDCPAASLNKPLEQWKMEIDDSPILRYIYRNFRPRRHLEFGTLRGDGTLACLEECDATVWTINLPGGEDKPDGRPAYGAYPEELAAAKRWAKKVGMPEQNNYRADSLGFIGRLYMEKEAGNRVCQIYCDSTKWDISNYPPGFFDTALIDGGHQEDIVLSDTAKAFGLLRSGGLIIWHDFCPPIYDKFETTLGVMRAIHQSWEWINEQTCKLFWIYPSYILLGVKK